MTAPLNYSTKISVHKTVGEVQQLLAIHGADDLDLVKKHRPHAIHYSAIPAHCTDCAQPTDGEAS